MPTELSRDLPSGVWLRSSEGLTGRVPLTSAVELPSGVLVKLAEVWAPWRLGVLYMLVAIHHRSKKKASTRNQEEKTLPPVAPSSALYWQSLTLYVHWQRRNVHRVHSITKPGNEGEYGTERQYIDNWPGKYYNLLKSRFIWCQSPSSFSNNTDLFWPSVFPSLNWQQQCLSHRDAVCIK